ncbi:MAG: biotin/lipoyl-containing protein [Sphingopyxis sp.]|uniref:biotin/lipoyl-containing protein n=1 Tax=Sphingopyxis sp. TaxID=1908224 RepID=UPI003D6D3202
MSDVQDPFAAAIDDLRALMTSFLDSDWSEAHVIDARGEIFIAREGGGPNPLLDEVGGYEAADVPAAGALRDLAAPHVATLVSILAPGDRVAAGAELARLSVLDEEQPFLSSAAGEVAEVCVSAGALVEHGTILVRFRESGE